MRMIWMQDKHERYIILNGDRNRCVRVKPVPSGRILWQCDNVCDYADTVEAAKEMVEGLAVSGMTSQDYKGKMNN